MPAHTDDRLIARLCCPVDKGDLEQTGHELVCAQGHSYRILNGIPIMLLPDVAATHERTFADTLAAEADLDEVEVPEGEIDPHVQEAIAATNGSMYLSLVRKLHRYPIPEIDLLPAEPDRNLLLDVGCNWGRWSIAASRLGYETIGIDPWFRAVSAARRVARSVGATTCHFVVGDARHLPFRDDMFHNAFSYSVLQHFSHTNAREAFREIGRVLQPGGHAKIQMLQSTGPLALFRQLARGFRKPSDFQVRYWRPSRLYRAVAEDIGRTEVSVDGFFTANPQVTDLDLLPARFRLVVRASELLRRSSRRVPALRWIADSVYLDVTAQEQIG